MKRPNPLSGKLGAFFKVAVVLVGMCVPSLPGAEEVTNPKEVLVMPLTGVINPSAASFVREGLRQAEERKAECVILMLSTPGGMMISMDEIVEGILNSKVPVVAYISPKGARAASAGVFIALSADVVAMAPGTSMGAAHPVDMQGKMASDKIVSAASATMRSIAQRRKRNVEWAESTVKKSKAVTAQEALELKVTDLISENLEELLVQLNGRAVMVERVSRLLSTKGAKVIQLNMTQRERFLQTLADPNVAYVLFTLGMLGLIYEFSAPGFGFPGIVGAIGMILGLYAFNAITVSMAGLLLMVASVLMFIMEVKIPSHGALTVGGGIAFALGSLLLFSPHLPTFQLSLSLVGSMSVVMMLFFGFVVVTGLRAQRRALVSGRETLIGLSGEARTKIGRTEGMVHVAGEEWSASTDGEPIHKGAAVKIVGVQGNHLKVISVDR